MKLFVFTRYKGAHQDDGFVIIAANHREEAEAIIAERFYGGRHEIVTNQEYSRLIREIGGIPNQAGLIACDDQTVKVDL